MTSPKTAPRAQAKRLAAQAHFRTPILRSPFHDCYAALMAGSNWTDWAGYDSATFVQDSELEYFAIRSTAGVFDMTPMVKYRVTGKDAEQYLNRLTLRDVTRLRVGRVQYTAWCDGDGKVLDDGTLFRFGADNFLLCCQEFHLPWLSESAHGFDVTITEITDDLCGLALQGPTSAAILCEADFDGAEKLKPFDMAEFAHDGGTLTISRTGFTGDLGYELLVENARAVSLWDRLWQAGELRGILAIGSAALDVARIEAGFIVANSDFITADLALRNDRTRQPDEIGLGWMVDLEKPYFNGRRAIVSARNGGLNTHILVGLEIDGNEPATDAIIYHNKQKQVGLVTAAIWSPTAKKNIALATLERPFGVTQTSNLWVQIYAARELQYHKMWKPATVVKRPFIQLARRRLTPPADY